MEERHKGEEHHHHHHHGIEDVILAIQMLLDSLNSRVEALEAKILDRDRETARLYKVLSYIVEALIADNEEERRKSLLEARRILERGDLKR